MALDPMLNLLHRFPQDDFTLPRNTSIQHALQAHLRQNPTIPGSALISEILAGRLQLLPDTGPHASSILSVLNNSITSFFAQGPRAAGNLLTEYMIPMITNSKVKKMRTPASIIYEKPCGGLWQDSEAAATLTALLATPRERLPEVEAFFDVTLAKVTTIPSASLAEAFKAAKVKALGGHKITTVVVVSLVDVYMLEMMEMGLQDQCTGFGHDFVLGIGPDGVVLWQGSKSCSFNNYLAQGGASVKSWVQADDFVKDFGKLTDGRKVCCAFSDEEMKGF